MMNVWPVPVAVLLAVCAPTAHAQSLGEIARKIEASRKDAAESVVFDERDLNPELARGTCSPSAWTRCAG